MNIEVRPYDPSEAETWDRFVEEAHNGTFLHTRRFLSYHGDRFQDRSLVIEDRDSGNYLGVFPAALDPERGDRVVSHPGITYAGIVHQGGLRGTAMIKTLNRIQAHYHSRGLKTMRYKAVPYIYHREPVADDIYALFRNGARRYRCDLISTLDFGKPPSLSKDRRRHLKRAMAAGITFDHGSHCLELMWDVLDKRLVRRHGKKPVHTLEEMRKLQDMFPENIACEIALADGKIGAGVVLFKTPVVLHGQYSAVTEEGESNGALTALIHHCVEKYRGEGYRYFETGNSNEEDGRILNEGLYQFKASFGAGGVAQEFYELDLAARVYDDN